MPDRNNKEVIAQIIDKLFDIAGSKMKDDSDKAVLEGLRKYVSMVDEDLLAPKPKYMDAFFFPCEKNIEKLIQYISKA